MYEFRADRANDPDFGPRYLCHVGQQPFGFADYNYSPASGVPGQQFTMMFLGPAGHYPVPAPALTCLVLSIATPLALLLAAGLRWRRRPATTRLPAVI